MLVIFRNPRKALRCAVAMQRALAAYDEGLPEEDKVLLCVGLGYGRILRIGDADVFGAEVNAASKLGEDRAKAWEILVTGSVRSALAEPAEGEAWDFEDLQDPPSGCSSIHRLRYELRG